jgi:hypothetical protein
MGLKGLLEVMNNFEKVKAKGFRACRRSKFTKAICQLVEKFKKIENVEIHTYFKLWISNQTFCKSIQTFGFQFNG